MKIVYVLELFYPNIGGVEKLFLSLAENNVANGNSVKVITTRYHKDIDKHELYKGIEIIRLPLKNRFGFTFFSYFHIRKHIKQADIVHTTSYNAALPAYFASKHLKKKCIITFHEFWGDLWNTLPGLSFIEKKLYKYFEKYIVRLPFDQFVAPSQYTAEKLIQAGVSTEKVRRIYNGIDYESYKTPEAVKQNSYVYFGRAGVSKGLEMLIRVASKINSENNYKLTLVLPTTKDKWRKRLEKLISKTDSKQTIQIVNSFPEKADLILELIKHEFVVIPSVSEGFCFSAVEAIALNIPVLSSGKGALREVVSGDHLHMEKYTEAELEKNILKAFEERWNHIPVKSFETTTTINEYNILYNHLSPKNK